MISKFRSCQCCNNMYNNNKISTIKKCKLNEVSFKVQILLVALYNSYKV